MYCVYGVVHIKGAVNSEGAANNVLRIYSSVVLIEAVKIVLCI